jgi:hypothetical protein
MFHHDMPVSLHIGRGEDTHQDLDATAVYTYEGGYPASYDDPGDGPEIELIKLMVGKTDLLPIIDVDIHDDIVMYICENHEEE